MTDSSHKVSFGILTDLHAFDPSHASDGTQRSWLRTDEGQCQTNTHPFLSLFDRVEKDNISTDFLLCCGDMSDRAHPAAQTYVWDRLNTLKTKLSAKRLIGTVGNHDVDSRGAYSDNDPKGLLQSLASFPIDCPDLTDKFWSRNYINVDCDGVRLINLNSAAYHGFGGENFATEYERGRVSERTIDRLVVDLKLQGHRHANVLMCHHHPVRNNLLSQGEDSEMLDGDKLVNALADAGVGDWLVVHGHKHLPRLVYAAGSANAPIIFSAGSFSTREFPPSHIPGRNEFYVLEVDIPKTPNGALTGTLKTWIWSLGNGWGKPSFNEGFPHTSGFGERSHPNAMAAQVLGLLTKAKGSMVLWSEVEHELPALKSVLPADLKALIAKLKSDGVSILYTDLGEPYQLQFKVAA